MELKRIIARDTRSANEKAIQLYGPDVLIISTQRVEGQTELIVAVDTPVQTGAAPARADASMLRPAPPVEGEVVIHPADKAQAFARALEVAMVPSTAPLAAPSMPEGMTDALTALSRRAQAQQSQTMAAAQAMAAATLPAAAPEVPQTSVAPVIAPVSPEPVSMPTLADFAGDAQGARASRVSRRAREDVSQLVSSWATAEVQSVDGHHALRRSQETVELLRQEMAALRQEFMLSRQMVVMQGQAGLTPPVQELLAQLMDLGVPASLRTLLMDSVRECDTASEALAHIGQLLQTALERPSASVPQSGVHALCGPSGAGKTLMVARLAIEAAVHTPVERQAIISFRDGKPGAWSQLQVLAAQAGVSCYRAPDEQALDVLLQELSDRSLIWIDTQGNDFVQQAIPLAERGLALHAVLPVDAATASVQKVMGLRDWAWASLMLSKFDEAAHPWPLVKGLCDSPIPVSAVSLSGEVGRASRAFLPAELVQLALAPVELPQACPPEMIAPVKIASVKKPSLRQAAVAPLESVSKPVRSRSRASQKVMNG